MLGNKTIAYITPESIERVIDGSQNPVIKVPDPAPEADKLSILARLSSIMDKIIALLLKL